MSGKMTRIETLILLIAFEQTFGKSVTSCGTVSKVELFQPQQVHLSLASEYA
jgi:hypothetical protein